MLKNTLIFCLLCFHVSHGIITTVDESKRAFMNLQIKMEVAISITRDDVNNELYKLDEVLNHFRYKIEQKSSSLRKLVYKKNVEAMLSEKSIAHCIRAVKILSKNLDLYNFHQCATTPCHIRETLVEAKQVSLAMSNRRSYCIANFKTKPWKLLPCLQKAIEDSAKDQKQIFRKLNVVRRNALRNGLSCIQDNFNIIIKELCLLTCQFEECVVRKCLPSGPKDKKGHPDPFLIEFK